MFQIRIHGRGGQGVVTAAEILATAAFDEGKYALAFPSFGSERMGAPVMAFCRLSTYAIRSREPVLTPDALIVQDPTLLHQADLFHGLGQNSFILINSRHEFEDLGLGVLSEMVLPERCFTIPATEIARKCVGKPLPNAALMGAFAAASKQLRLESVISAIRARFPGRTGEMNAEAARKAYAHVLLHQRETVNASAN